MGILKRITHEEIYNEVREEEGWFGTINGYRMLIPNNFDNEKEFIRYASDFF